MITGNKPLSVTCKSLTLSAMGPHDQLGLAAAAVAEHFGLKDEHIGDVGGGDCVGHGGLKEKSRLSESCRCRDRLGAKSRNLDHHKKRPK